MLDRPAWFFFKKKNIALLISLIKQMSIICLDCFEIFFLLEKVDPSLKSLLN